MRQAYDYWQDQPGKRRNVGKRTIHFWSLTSRTDDGPREPSPLRARQVRMKELPLHSHRGLRGSASHPRPTDEVRLEPKSHHAVREREVSKRTPFITLGRSTRGGCREATTRGMILDLHHRHSVEGSTEVQGNAPLLSVTRREKETPESSYPLSHIRQDERAGRDSQEAFAQRASKKRAADSPRRQPRRY